MIEAGARSDALFNITDFFPSLCSLAGIPVPRSVEGIDVKGDVDASKKSAVPSQMPNSTIIAIALTS